MTALSVSILVTTCLKKRPFSETSERFYLQTEKRKHVLSLTYSFQKSKSYILVVSIVLWYALKAKEDSTSIPGECYVTRNRLCPRIENRATPRPPVRRLEKAGGRESIHR